MIIIVVANCDVIVVIDADCKGILLICLREDLQALSERYIFLVFTFLVCFWCWHFGCDCHVIVVIVLLLFILMSSIRQAITERWKIFVLIVMMIIFT
ncbi:hypothetical protein T492DRAFT_1042169 [Pavlovales sp. CCMP2436]|nr:hypothetical protein T492DRAFT_1042169 [Pavlovales sp. CCMP2436]